MAEHEYPEHERLAAVADQSHLIGEFLDWAYNTKGWEFAEWVDGSEYSGPVLGSIESILADYFSIDLHKIEAEKVAMIKALREANEL